MANKKLYREDVLQMLFADSDSEGEYLPFGIDDRSSNDHASPGTSLPCNGAAVQGESVHEAQTSDHFDPLPNGDGDGRGECDRSVKESCSCITIGSAVLMIGQIASIVLIAHALRAASTGAVSVG